MSEREYLIRHVFPYGLFLIPEDKLEEWEKFAEVVGDHFFGDSQFRPPAPPSYVIHVYDDTKVFIKEL